MDGAMSSGRSIFCTSDLCFFLPHFRYSYGFLKLVVVGCTGVALLVDMVRYPRVMLFYQSSIS
jgi:hypothetical protein